MSNSWPYEEPIKRTLGIRDKQILWRKAEKKCQNPTCGKSLDFDEMQVGHKIAASKGGRATLKNCVCLCWRCNKLQGTDSWSTFLKKQGVLPENTKTKEILKRLNLNQLKFLAKKHHIKVKGYIETDLLGEHSITPSKSSYVNKLTKAISEKEIDSDLKEMPKPEKKKKRKRILHTYIFGQRVD